MSSIDASSIFIEPSEEDQEHEKAHLALLHDRYKDTITTLPKEKWVGENLYKYQGFWYMSNYAFSVETMLDLQDTFRAQPIDIYVVTLPKSGTTWMKALVFAIVNRERYKNNPAASHPLLIYNPHKCVPFLETEVYRKTPSYVDAGDPRLFATHTPYASLPRSIVDSGCRIVYMCRNPKDVLVSTFHFMNKVKESSLGEIPLDLVFERFSNGVTPYGPYWDHVKAYYNASLEDSKNILFMTYEDMQEDIANNVKLLAMFLGYPFTKDEEARGVVDEIVRLCSFENLREVNKHGDFRKGVPNKSFFREGKVGDWKNNLTDEMNEILNQITKEKFNGLDISFDAGALVRTSESASFDTPTQ